MTTVVNNPAPVNTESSGGSSLLIGALVLFGLIVLIVYVGIPAIQRMGPFQVNIPATQVNIPDKVDVNVKQTQ